jgi:hypothetical protein
MEPFDLFSKFGVCRVAGVFSLVLCGSFLMSSNGNWSNLIVSYRTEGEFQEFYRSSISASVRQGSILKPLP